MIDGLGGCFTVRTTEIGVRHVLLATMQNIAKSVSILQAPASETFLVLYKHGTDPNVPAFENRWTQPDLSALSMMLPVAAPLFGDEVMFDAPKRLSEFLENDQLTAGEWIIAVTAQNVQLLTEAGIPMNYITPPFKRY
jgi:hypothetical protein